MFIAENLKVLRKKNDMTQEEVAEMLSVTPQSVSKWERGATYPDITLLPALANLFKTSVDALIGMDKMNDAQSRRAIFITEKEHLRNSDYDAAAAVLTEALQTFPNDTSLLSELAMVLALDGEPVKLKQSITLCERILSGNPTEKVRHTTRAALCFIYFKNGDIEKAMEAAKHLPHTRESRELVVAELSKELSLVDSNAYLRRIALGEPNE